MSNQSLVTAGSSTLLQLAQTELAPYGPGVIIQSDKCWVHGGVGSIEYHHIVPRVYGGEHGPQVAICGNCHTGVHGLAFKSLLFDGGIVDAPQVLALVEQFAKDWISKSVLKSDRRERTLLRAWALGQVIYRARLVVMSGDTTNKKTQFHHTFNGETMRMLKLLTKSYGVNQQQMVEIAIQELFTRKIGTLDGV